MTRQPNGGSPPTRATPDAVGPTLEALYRVEWAPMVSLATLLVGSGGSAEEIVQDSFVAVGQRWATLTNPGGYLRATVVNGCRMWLRRRALEDRHSTEPPEPLVGPAEVVELYDALTRLPERARVAIALRFLVGHSDQEIAELLDCRIGTVGSIVHRALRTLRKELS